MVITFQPECRFMPDLSRILCSAALSICRLSDRTGKIVSTVLVVTVGATVIEVVARYVFNAPTSWSYEVEMFTCGALYAMVGAYVLLHKGHVSVDIAYRRFNPRIQRLVNLVVVFPLIMTFGLALTYMGVEYAWTSFRIGERSYTSWAPLLWPIKMTLPIGSGLLVLQAVADFIRELFGNPGDTP